MSDVVRVFFDLLGELIGQPYDDPRYFWGCPCVPAKAHAASGGTGENPGPSNDGQQWRLQLRLDALRRSGDFNLNSVPAELTSVVAGRFTPFIGLQAAAYQVPRVARARGEATELLQQLIEMNAEAASDGGRRINVLRLNMLLDDIPAAISDNGPRRSEKSLRRVTSG